MDSLIVLLLCSHLALPRDGDFAARPLSASQWHSLLAKLQASSWSEPSDLLGQSAADIERTLEIKPESAQRVAQLLDRGGQIAFEIERLADRGIWILAETDERYPRVLVDRLGEAAPPVLFGAGPVETLSAGGIAMVGSRDLDAAGARFAETLGALCAKEQVTVISGGARGADRISMLGALDAGGCAVGILAESLDQALRDSEAAQFIRNDQLALVTMFHPSAGFSVGNAMARNKLLYCLADLAVVVSSGEGSGGTWQGATENLDRTWVPLFVRDDPEAPAGNRALIQRGGVPITRGDLPDSALLPDLKARVAQHATVSPAKRSYIDGREEAPSCQDLFFTVWPHLEPFLAEARTVEEVTSTFVLDPHQTKAWLKRAVADGRATMPTKRPPRYQRITPRLL
ncbi:MAG: DNA-processing protein DprA [Dehalococcoidia bacterium]